MVVTNIVALISYNARSLALKNRSIALPSKMAVSALKAISITLAVSDMLKGSFPRKMWF